MVKFFLAIYDRLHADRTLMWSLLLGSVVLLALCSLRMTLKEDVADFLPADGENRDICWAFSHLDAADNIVVTLSCAEEGAGDEFLLMDAVDTLEAMIMRHVPQEYVDKLIARADAVTEVTDFIVGNLPYYLTDADYGRMDSLLAVGSLDGEMLAARAAVSSPVGAMARSIVNRDPLFLSASRLKALEGFRTGSDFHTSDGYIFTSDGSALVTLSLGFGSSDTGRSRRFISALQRALDDTEEAFGGAVKTDALGSVFIADTNASQIKRDSVISVLLAAVLIAVLLVSFFHSGRSILLVGAAIAYGFLVAFGLTALIDGNMSMIVLGMGSIIIGIAANYPLHFLTHIKQGCSPRESLSDIVVPLTTGNITTVGAFLSLLFIASPAMHDLGLFAALLLVGTILFSLVFLPHLVREDEAENREGAFWNRVGETNLSTNGIVLAAVAIITIVLSFFDGAHFDGDLRKINYMTERQRASMDKMTALAQGHSNITYVAVPGGDMDEALDNYMALSGRIDSLPLCVEGAEAVRALHDFVPSAELQRKRLDRWNAFVSEKGGQLLSLLGSSASAAGFTDDAFAPFEEMLSRDWQVQPVSYFKPLTDNVATGFMISDDDRCAVVATVGSRENLTDRIDESLDDIPSLIVFDSSSMTSRMVDSLSRDFDKVLYICAFIVFALLWLSFGRLELALIAFLPLTIAWVWILGLMSIFGINFNIVNIILATFIFGMGDDYTIFITEGAMYERTYGRKMLGTYRKTIVLSALIMFSGIGALIVARHPAMHSLAEVTIIGMFTVVLLADIVPPFLYRLLTRKKGKWRKYPLTVVNFGATVLAFVIFLVGALFITVAGFFLITLTFGSKRGQYAYHCLLSSVSRFIFNNVFFTRHTVECDEKFERQAVIVANHQSHLDLMALLMLTPKMVVVTNKWVWNNPFYGLLIRYADFCPVEDFLSDDLTRLEQKIAEGYSVLIFPEGTRTTDGRIGRFHRGAFYLAEKFSLDILPVVLHGLDDVLPKEDLLLRKGHMTVKVLPRIAPSDTSFGEDYRERSRSVRRLMAAELEKISEERETADYFADRVKHCYLYKGAEISRQVRHSMRVNGNYASLAEALPSTGRVLMVNPSCGEPALVCALVHEQLQVEASFDDEMTLALASCCAGIPSNLKFVAASDAAQDCDVRVIFENEGWRVI